MNRETLDRLNVTLEKYAIEVAYADGRWTMYGDKKGFAHSMPKSQDITPVLEHTFLFLLDCRKEAKEPIEFIRDILSENLRQYIRMKETLKELIETTERRNSDYLQNNNMGVNCASCA